MASLPDRPPLRRSFKLAPVLSGLKLRLSGGRSGSEAIGSYNSLAAWSIGSPYAIGTTTFFNGATINRFANPNLHWETTTQYDLGLDLGLFDEIGRASCRER